MSDAAWRWAWGIAAVQGRGGVGGGVSSTPLKTRTPRHMVLSAAATRPVRTCNLCSLCAVDGGCSLGEQRSGQRAR